jgi:hypothetical protein
MSLALFVCNQCGRGYMNPRRLDCPICGGTLYEA